ncbi:hypothetical protein AB0875_26695, partial [Micromonospora gifhornensis]|uniref:hypothetical protein n=1 Tax=Micromonospora gifhornensis TaxID=84594 RepID=UPI0034518131
MPFGRQLLDRVEQCRYRPRIAADLAQCECLHGAAGFRRLQKRNQFGITGGRKIDRAVTRILSAALRGVQDSVDPRIP